jgi:hypothetical protein
MRPPFQTFINALREGRIQNYDEGSHLAGVFIGLIGWPEIVSH